MILDGKLPDSIVQAAQALRSGALVGLPTETVYGLAADADSDGAVAQVFATKLEGVVVTIARKAGVDGRLFGSVTNYDVADGLKALGFTVEKSDIRMPNGPLKAIGESTLEVALHTDVLASITVTVVGEQ